ncbi:hypothetical protein BDN72DRAFT_845722 [Pluteus cervinus]|uniref:Uncharacterized protein n=1 Tax=Pluteus cervinus TaxID=181527 RepID=A0ACD3AHW9_9AGAR|nr:hypothetical protein BDN72DRAFT_845722 [Pluteus cervinus]
MLAKAFVTLFAVAELCLGATGALLDNRDASTTLSSQLSSAFTSSYWIWIPESNPLQAPPEDIALRKTFTSPSGKTATDATAVITADNVFVLFVNGQPIGSSVGVNLNWQTAYKYSIALNATTNTFAVRATNQQDVGPGGSGPAGLLAAFEVHYSDGSSDIFTTDSSWKAIELIPWNFQLAEYNDSAWGSASTIDKYGSGPWASEVIVQPTQPSNVSLSNAQWIWARNTDSKQVAFRRQASPPSGKVAIQANIIVSADSDFELFLNGQLIGSAPNSPGMWAYPQRFDAVALNTHLNVFAVSASHDSSRGTNTPGFIAAIQTMYNDQSSDILYTDSTWLAVGPPPAGFEAVGADDSNWVGASSAGLFNVAPWNGNVLVVDALQASLANTNATDPNSPYPSNLPAPSGSSPGVGPPGFGRPNHALSISPNLLACFVLFGFHILA